MFTIDKDYSNLIDIKKSRFFSYIYPIFNEKEKDDILLKLKLEHKDATHICYACVISESHYEKCSDDGEPEGTAGKPILEIIKKNNLSNVLIVVVRYFGGIKLGAGGLLRAYSNSASEVVDKSRKCRTKILTEYRIECSLEIAKSLQNFIKNNNYNIKNQEFSNKYIVTILADDINKLHNFDENLVIEEKGKERIFYD